MATSTPSSLHHRWATAADHAVVKHGLQQHQASVADDQLMRWLEDPAMQWVGDQHGHLHALVTIDLDQAILGPLWRVSDHADLDRVIKQAGEQLLQSYGLTDDEQDPVRQWLNSLGIVPQYGALHRLRRVAEAETLSAIENDCFDRPQLLLPRAAAAWQAMRRAAEADGVTLQVVSAYRSVDYQAGLIERKLAAGQAIDDILNVSAAPGYSEHHSGRAVDLTTPGCEVLSEAFADTPAHQWLQHHAAQHGFVCSFPANNRHGLIWEPWHWCYRPDEIWR
jgi:D-alanyl-D-alanine carboxypeptidase